MMHNYDNTQEHPRSGPSRQNAAPKPRAVLTRDDVLAIFHTKASLQTATKVSRFYGVSEKAIRDIWTGRTWAAETWHLDKMRAIKIKPPGRPHGSRGKKPRKPKENCKHCSPRSKNVPQAATARTSSVNWSGVDASTPAQHCTCIGDYLPAFVPQFCWVGTHQDVDFDRKIPVNFTKSLDEQLFEWECNFRREYTSDPFKNDWLEHCGLI